MVRIKWMIDKIIFKNYGIGKNVYGFFFMKFSKYKEIVKVVRRLV